MWVFCGILDSAGGDGTHSQKTAPRTIIYHRKGRTPITKNVKMIRVFDESGNEVNPTYPKRARGLVKQGRARWADDADDVIVLTSDIRNTEAAYPSEVHKVHTLEDTEMFEYNVNEEITETAKVPETIETIEETGLPLNEELNRLYGILENIDRMLMNVSCMGLSLPEDMNGMEPEGVVAVAQAINVEGERLRELTNRYADMRTQTIGLIQKVKDDAKPQRRSDGFDEEAFLAEQLKVTMASYKAMNQHLNDQLRCGEISMDGYRAQIAAVQVECDERVKKLRGELNALKYGG